MVTIYCYMNKMGYKMLSILSKVKNTQKSRKMLTVLSELGQFLFSSLYFLSF